METCVKYLGQCAGIFQIFGHQYFSLKTLTAKNQSESPTLTRKLFFAFNLVLFTSLMGAFAFFISDKSSDDQLIAKNIISIAAKYSVYLGLVLMIWVALVHDYVATRQTKSFYLNCIHIADICERDFNHAIEHRLLRNSTFKFLFSIGFANIFGEFVYNSLLDEPKSAVQMLFTVSPLLLLNTIILKFVFFVKLVNLHLETICKLLRKIYRPSEDSEVFVGISVMPVQDDSNDKIYKLRNLRKIYNVVAENANIINQVMGVTILLMVSVKISVITTYGYGLFLAMLGNTTIEKSVGNVCGRFEIS